MSQNSGLKRIEAILKPERLDAVKAALDAVGVRGITVTDVKGVGRAERTEGPRGPRGPLYDVHVILEIVLPAELLSDAVAAIGTAARTGQHGEAGDGNIYVSSIDEVVRVRTGERGPAAL